MPGWHPANNPEWPGSNAQVSWDTSNKAYPELSNTSVVYTCAEPGHRPEGTKDDLYVDALDMRVFQPLSLILCLDSRVNHVCLLILALVPVRSAD